jgi:hypothetical protein
MGSVHTLGLFTVGPEVAQRLNVISVIDLLRWDEVVDAVKPPDSDIGEEAAENCRL